MQRQPENLAVPDWTRIFSHPRLRTLPLTTEEKVSARSDGLVLGGRKLLAVTGAGCP